MTPADRRQFLTGAGLAAAACCGLAGCANGSPQAARSTQTFPKDPTTASASAPASGSAGGPSVAVSKVPTGGGAVLTDSHLVVTQPEDGTFKAFTSICPHQGCDVARVENNVIICDCHGSKFSAVDGSVQTGPATSGLEVRMVTKDGDNLLITG